MTLHNAPTGWAAFREFRQQPAHIPDRRHGNYQHGLRSKEAIAGRRLIRLCFRALSGRVDYVPDWLLPLLRRPRPLGWAAYRATRAACDHLARIRPRGQAAQTG